MKFDLLIAASHPCLSGHFPGNPIVPAVVLIDHIIYGIKQEYPNISIRNIAQLKFIKPLKPDQLAKVIVTEKNAHTLQVRIELKQQIIVKGDMHITHGELS